MHPLDPGGRDRALTRARRLRWFAAIAAAGITVGGTAMARASFRGHQKGKTTVAATVTRPVQRKQALPARPMPNLVPLPPSNGQSGGSTAGSGGGSAPAPTPARAPAPVPAPAPAPAPAPVVSGGS
jgi:hypothetical protein